MASIQLLVHTHPGVLHICILPTPASDPHQPSSRCPLFPPPSTRPGKQAVGKQDCDFSLFINLLSSTRCLFTARSLAECCCFHREKSKERDYNYGSSPEREAAAGVGSFPCLGVFCINKEPGALEVCGKGIRPVFLLLPVLSISCLFKMTSSH